MLETVVASPDDATADLFLPQALGQVDRLVTLVNRFLEQARAESGEALLSTSAPTAARSDRRMPPA